MMIGRTVEEMEQSDKPKSGRMLFGMSFHTLLGLICTSITVMAERELPKGLDLVFLLPVAYLICSVLFRETFTYFTESLGMTVLYATIAVRYLGTPVLMAMTGRSVNTLISSSYAYSMSILISVFELFVLLIMIGYVWPKYRKKSQDRTEDPDELFDFRISPIGLVFLVFLAVTVLTRGHLDNVIEHLSTWFHFQENNTVLYTYDMLGLMLIKNVVAVMLICFFARRYRKAKGARRYGFLLLAFLTGLANTFVFDYRERTDLIILFLGTMYVLVSCFKKERKLFMAVFPVIGVVLLAVVFSTGTLGTENTSSVLSTGFLKNLEKSSELYTSGPSVIAKTIDTYDAARSEVSLGTVLYDISDGMSFLSMIPFTRFIPELLHQGAIGTTGIFVSSIGGYPYILPNYSLCSLYVSDVFGWLLEIGFIYLSVRMITAFANARNKSENAFFIFAIVFFEVFAAGSVFCSNFQLFWHSVSHEPFWMLLFYLINGIGDKLTPRYHR